MNPQKSSVPGDCLFKIETILFRCRLTKLVAFTKLTVILIWFDSRLKVDLHTETPEPIYISKNRVAEFKEWLIGK